MDLGKIREHPRRWLALLAGGLFLPVLFLLGFVYPPGPFGQLTYGPVELSIVLPAHPAATREPLLSAGVRGASFTLFIEYVDGSHVRFVHEAWDTGGPSSELVSVVPGPVQTLLVNAPGLAPPSREYATPVSVKWNGQEILHRDAPFIPGAPKSLYIGVNPLADFPDEPGTYFSGEIRSVRRIKEPPSDFLHDRLLANLRYEAQIRPFPLFLSAALACAYAMAAVLLVLPGTERREFADRLWMASIPLAIVALPLLPMLDLSRSFNGDWLNHGWLMNYYGHYLWHHHRFPRAVNTNTTVGQALPAFYGHFLYAIGGVFSSVLGGDLAIRVTLGLTLLAQCLVVRHTFRKATGDLRLANIAAALVCWSIYSLTNLLNRGAITEFFAVGMLTCAICFLLNLTIESEPKLKRVWTVGIALAYSLATIHPITALFGGMLLGVIWIVAFVAAFDRRTLVAAAALCAPAVALVLAPWAYAMARYGSSLRVALRSAGTMLKYGAFDVLASRLAPFPIDVRSLGVGAKIDPPYLDTQLSVPLLILAAGGTLLLWRRAQRVPPLAWLGWIVLIAALLLSISPGLVKPLAFLLNRLEFAYRLVSYQNLGLLLVLFATALALKGERWLVSAGWIALAIGGVSCLEKLTHGAMSPQPAAIADAEPKALTIPYTFYADDDYTTELGGHDSGPGPRQPANFHVAGGARFGAVDPLEINTDAPVTLALNVSPFPANYLVLDGQLIDPAGLKLDGTPLDRVHFTRQTNHILLPVGPGRHRIEYRFEPGAVWLALRAISEIALAGLTLAFTILAWRSRRVATARQPRESYMGTTVR